MNSSTTSRKSHIAFTIKTRSISSVEITTRLGIKPDSVANAGESIRTLPTGKVHTGMHTWTSWSHIFSLEDQGVESGLLELIELCNPHRHFLKDILEAGGTVEAQMRFSGKEHTGDVICPDTLKKVSDLGIGLSMEVFPDM